MKTIIIFNIACLLSLNSNAQGFLNRLAFLTSNSDSYSSCPDSSGPTLEVCSTSKSKQYVYDQEFGGRFSATNNILLTENKLEHNLPAGWYFEKTVKLDSRLFSPGNFDISLTLFGISGFNLTGGAALSECDYGTSSTPIPLLAR